MPRVNATLDDCGSASLPAGSGAEESHGCCCRARTRVANRAVAASVVRAWEWRLPKMAESAGVPDLASATKASKPAPRHTHRSNHTLDGAVRLRVAPQRHRSPHLASPLLLGRGWQCPHKTFVYASDSGLASDGSHGARYVLPDQNGWSRSLHFESRAVVLRGLLYVLPD
jgi:hypothetical protein